MGSRKAPAQGNVTDPVSSRSDNHSTTVRWSRARWAAVIGFAVCFGVFALNVVFGSMAMSRGWDNPLSLGRVTEFLLLFASAILLMLAALASEASARKAEPDEPGS
jgi:protein-S-isoprenylcysteine O-methyltransferase Ste14